MEVSGKSGQNVAADGGRLTAFNTGKLGFADLQFLCQISDGREFILTKIIYAFADCFQKNTPPVPDFISIIP